MARQLLLLSNSTNSGEPYLDWCKSTISDFVRENTTKILFIPYAGVTLSYREYTEKVNQALAEFNIKVRSIEDFDNKADAIETASAIFVGGGNTFHLLRELQNQGLVEPLRNKVLTGAPYIGWSAGSNVACPTICTTNDMPIVQPKSFEALDFIDFQINPHFTTKTIADHGGESRVMRLQEYLAANPTQIVTCLPEATYLEIRDNKIYYTGTNSATILSSKETIVLESGDITSIF